MRYRIISAAVGAVLFVGAMSFCGNNEPHDATTILCNLHTGEVVAMPSDRTYSPDDYAANLTLCGYNE